MRQDSIIQLIDKSIHQSYVDGHASHVIIENINRKMENIKKSINRDSPDINISDYMNVNWDKIESARLRYVTFYIKHSTKRIETINWIDKEKMRFRKYSNSQLFNLIKLKEKLSI